jgi:hypothetical protein
MMLLHWCIPHMLTLLPDDMTLERIGDAAMSNPHVRGTPAADVVPVREGVSGNVMFEVPTPDSMRVARQRLRRFLAGPLVADGVVRFGKTLEGIGRIGGGDDGDNTALRLSFADGSTHEADHVAGVDGMDSTVRQLLFAGDPERARSVSSGMTFAMARARLPDAELTKELVAVSPLTTLLFFPRDLGSIGGGWWRRRRR